MRCGDLIDIRSEMFMTLKKLILGSSFCLLLLLPLPTTHIQAQSDGALKEKLDFLKTKLESYLSYSIKEGDSPEVGSMRFEAVSFKSCGIAWRSAMETGNNAELPTIMRNNRLVNHVSVNLASIDPARTRIYVVESMLKRNLTRALILELKIRPGSPGFRNQMETGRAGAGTNTSLEERSSGFFFETRDRSVAEEV